MIWFLQLVEPTSWQHMCSVKLGPPGTWACVSLSIQKCLERLYSATRVCQCLIASDGGTF